MNNDMVNLTVSQPAIAIIGGGFSGSLVAAHLLRKATSPLVIHLIERSREVGRGAAYSTPTACYLLNVPAGKMSAFPDQPEHFLDWLKQNGQEEATAATFVPRQLYRHRITGEIAELLDQARQSGQLVPHAGRVQTCRELENGVKVTIQDADAPIASVYRALKPGGRFVAEFGGKGNVAAIAQAMTNTLETMGYPQLNCPWYFPSIGDYATRLERQGFEVIQATLSDRPTPLAGEEAGLANWLRMFAAGWLSPLSDGEKAQVVETLEEKLRSKLYHDGGWIADYRRIRLLAYKF